MGQPFYIGEPLGFDGATPPLGDTNPNFASDADKTATLAEYFGGSLTITASVSLTAGRKLKLPLVRGAVWDATNAMSVLVNVGGATGAVVPIDPGATVRVKCVDGANFASLSNGGDNLELILGDARVSSGTLDRTKTVHPIDTSSGVFTLTVGPAGYVGERHLVVDWGGAIETTPLAVTTGTSITIQHPQTGDRSSNSFSFGATAGVGFRNGSCFEIHWTGALWVALR